MEVNTFCPYPFNRVRVTSEGDVAMCCFQRRDPLSQDSAYIGNLLHNSFDEIWFGNLAEEIRDSTLNGDLHKKCQVPGCPYVSMRKPYNLHRVIYSEYPSFLEIDLPNTHCNVGLEQPNDNHPACIMCERAGPSDVFIPEKNLLDEVIKAVKHIIGNLQQIHIQGIAEPFYKDLIFDMFQWLDFDKFKERILISTTTNGTLFNKSRRSRYLAEAPNSITTFSVDAATPETFKKIRILPVFNEVVENLQSFCNERNKDKQFVRIHNNINTINVGEVIGMVHLAKKAGVNHLEFNPTDGFLREILVNKSNCGVFKKAEYDIIEECNKLGVSFSFIRPLDMGYVGELVQIV